MALKYNALETGAIEFQREVSIEQDGMVLTGSRNFVLAPSDDVSGQPQDVQDVCALWWTAEHVAAWTAIKAAATVPLTDEQIAASEAAANG